MSCTCDYRSGLTTGGRESKLLFCVFVRQCLVGLGFDFCVCMTDIHLISYLPLCWPWFVVAALVLSGCYRNIRLSMSILWIYTAKAISCLVWYDEQWRLCWFGNRLQDWCWECLTLLIMPLWECGVGVCAYFSYSASFRLGVLLCQVGSHHWSAVSVLALSVSPSVSSRLSFSVCHLLFLSPLSLTPFPLHPLFSPFTLIYPTWLARS